MTASPRGREGQKGDRMAKNPFNGVATGRKSASGDMDKTMSPSDGANAAYKEKRQGPNFSHSTPGKGPKHGGGTIPTGKFP